MESSSPLNVGYSCKHEGTACCPTFRPRLGSVAWWTATQWGAPDDMVRVLSAATWMLVWWVAEAVPLGVTSVLPLVLFPTLGVADVSATAAPYGSKFVFLFLGGFLIALALERWNLHRRFALHILVAAGGQPRRLLAGFMVATPPSLWISNGHHPDDAAHRVVGVVQNQLDDHPRFPVALLLVPPTLPTWGASRRWWAPRPTWPWRGWWKRWAGSAVFGMEHDGVAVFSAHVGLGVRLADTGPVPRVV